MADLDIATVLIAFSGSTFQKVFLTITQQVGRYNGNDFFIMG